MPTTDAGRTHQIQRPATQATQVTVVVTEAVHTRAQASRWSTSSARATDADRQLEALSQLFRENKMPDHGVDILEGVASGCSYADIGEPVELSAVSVRARMRQMRKVCRRRMIKLGLWPGMPPRRVVASIPRSVARIRSVA